MNKFLSIIMVWLALLLSAGAQAPVRFVTDIIAGTNVALVTTNYFTNSSGAFKRVVINVSGGFSSYTNSVDGTNGIVIFGSPSVNGSPLLVSNSFDTNFSGMAYRDTNDFALQTIWLDGSNYLQTQITAAQAGNTATSNQLGNYIPWSGGSGSNNTFYDTRATNTATNTDALVITMLTNTYYPAIIGGSGQAVRTNILTQTNRGTALRIMYAGDSRPIMEVSPSGVAAKILSVNNMEVMNDASIAGGIPNLYWRFGSLGIGGNGGMYIDYGGLLTKTIYVSSSGMNAMQVTPSGLINIGNGNAGSLAMIGFAHAYNGTPVVSLWNTSQGIFDWRGGSWTVPITNRISGQNTNWLETSYDATQGSSGTFVLRSSAGTIPRDLRPLHILVGTNEIFRAQTNGVLDTYGGIKRSNIVYSINNAVTNIGQRATYSFSLNMPATVTDDVTVELFIGGAQQASVSKAAGAIATDRYALTWTTGSGEVWYLTNTGVAAATVFTNSVTYW